MTPGTRPEGMIDVENEVADAIGYLRYSPSRSTVAQMETWKRVVDLITRVRAETEAVVTKRERKLAEALQQIHDVCDEELKTRFKELPPEQYPKWRTAMLLVVPRNMAKAALAAYESNAGEENHG